MLEPKNQLYHGNQPMGETADPNIPTGSKNTHYNLRKF